MTFKETPLQELFLNQLSESKVSVSIYLLNGIKLQGHIEAFDENVLVLSGTTPQLIYKHSISTIVPSQKIDIKW